MRRLSACGFIALLLAIGCEDEPVRSDGGPLVSAGDPAKPKPNGTEIRLIEARGKVEARTKGEWRAVAVGDQVETGGAVRTPSGASARLSIGDGTEVAVESNSEISFPSVGEKVARVRVEHGRLGARVTGEGVTLEVEAAGSSAIAKTSHGEFSVYNDGHGLVAIAAKAGEVKLTSRGGELTVSKGEQARVIADSAPAREKAERAVLLNVIWPEEKLTRHRQITVKGKTKAGSLVSVNGKATLAGPDGTFVATIPLRDGKNRIQVESTDLLGRVQTAESSMTVHRKAPSVKAKSEGLWEK